MTLLRTCAPLLLLSACATAEPGTPTSGDASPGADRDARRAHEASLGDATRGSMHPADAAGSEVSDATAPGDASSSDGPSSSDAADEADEADGSTEADTSSPSSPDGAAPSACSPGASEACATTCGSTGTATCAAGAWGACVPPAETCNLMDDDCSGTCDDILGCRIGIDRSDDSSTGQHFYTSSDGEASCCGYRVEQLDDFYLYATEVSGLAPFYRCRTSTGHLYTTDADCDGAVLEGTLGYIATSPVCGAVPLYALSNASSGDHLYTTSSAEAASAESGGYTLTGTAGYVWTAPAGSPSAVWPSPIHMVGSALTSVTGFPTAWYGFPIDGTTSFASLSGSVSVDNSADLYAEVLFILLYLPSGSCTTGRLPASTPEYGPAGAESLAQFIVKTPTSGTLTLPIDFTLPGGLPMTSCVLLGLNGGPVATDHDVTSSADLTLSFNPTGPSTSLIGAGGEFCFGQDSGCQAATTDDSKSFALVSPIASATKLLALYGDISDSTFDGTSSFAAPPTGAWTATNDIYVYHGSECSQFGVSSGIAGPGDYYAQIPADAVHLLSVPLSGSGLGVAEQPVYQGFTNTTLAAGDCLVTLWGLAGTGGFDNETQIDALTSP